MTGPVSSDRSFGLVFASVFGVVALMPLRHHEPIRWWALAPSFAFLVVSLSIPGLLAPLNRLWAKFAELLQRVTNPIVMGVLFFGMIAPLGMLFRLLGKDPLRRRWEPSLLSYWVRREGPLEAGEGMKNQF